MERRAICTPPGTEISGAIGAPVFADWHHALNLTSWNRCNGGCCKLLVS